MGIYWQYVKNMLVGGGLVLLNQVFLTVFMLVVLGIYSVLFEGRSGGGVSGVFLGLGMVTSALISMGLVGAVGTLMSVRLNKATLWMIYFYYAVFIWIWILSYIVPFFWIDWTLDSFVIMRVLDFGLAVLPTLIGSFVVTVVPYVGFYYFFEKSVFYQNLEMKKN